MLGTINQRTAKIEVIPKYVEKARKLRQKELDENDDTIVVVCLALFTFVVPPIVYGLYLMNHYTCYESNNTMYIKKT